MTSAITSKEFIRSLCAAMDMDSSRVTAIKIDAHAGGHVLITVDHLMDGKVAQTVYNSLGQDIMKATEDMRNGT